MSAQAGLAHAASDPAGDAIAEQAATWIVRLSADDAAEREQARSGFDAWQRADPRHAQEAARLQDFIDLVQGARENAGRNPRPARAALDAANAAPRRRGTARRLGTALALACLLAVPAWLTLQVYPWSYLSADLRTVAGQWQTHTLADGSRITLNSDSAVNLRFNAQRRVLELVQGEVLVDVAPDAARPFVVQTAHASMQALGTRFVVRRDADATLLTMLESRVAVRSAAQRSAHSADASIVRAGQRVRIAPQGLDAVQAVDARTVAQAWSSHQLVVDNQPLTEVLDELGRHRRGAIVYERARLEGIRVAAVLPLDDTDRALQLLVDSLPIRVRSLTAYLLWVDAAPASEK
ncbi:FecR family protein [Xylophilus sp. ASV27]|uniref:FecR family protein n=1 Tax=Xylophilus sp. ASV27 TaxID=2795129 RepID=UPI0018ED6458|nr:FecR domain-containing protein [Xylophilus sp. ASV27]